MSDAAARVVFGRKLDRPWLSPPGTAEGHFRFTRAKLPIRAASCSGTCLRSPNVQTSAPPDFVFRNRETKFKCFDTFDRGFSTADKLFALGLLLKVVHGGKIFSNVHSNQDFPGFIQIKTSRGLEYTFTSLQVHVAHHV